jgi:hypothetical protein
LRIKKVYQIIEGEQPKSLIFERRTSTGRVQNPHNQFLLLVATSVSSPAPAPSLPSHPTPGCFTRFSVGRRPRVDVSFMLCRQESFRSTQCIQHPSNDEMPLLSNTFLQRDLKSVSVEYKLSEYQRTATAKQKRRYLNEVG